MSHNNTFLRDIAYRYDGVFGIEIYVVGRNSVGGGYMFEIYTYLTMNLLNISTWKSFCSQSNGRAKWEQCTHSDNVLNILRIDFSHFNFMCVHIDVRKWISKHSGWIHPANWQYFWVNFFHPFLWLNFFASATWKWQKKLEMNASSFPNIPKYVYSRAWIWAWCFHSKIQFLANKKLNECFSSRHLSS